MILIAAHLNAGIILAYSYIISLSLFPDIPFPNKPYGFCGREPSCLLMPEAILLLLRGAQELCESRGGRPVLPVPNSPYVLSVDVKQH